MKLPQLLCIVLLICNASFAEPEPRKFYGSIILSDKKVVNGRLSVYWSHDLVVFENQDSISVLPAYKLSGFRYHDDPANINRKFVIIQTESNHRRLSTIFEIVVSGKVQILRRPKSVYHDQADDANGYRYYSFFDGILNMLADFAGNVYPKIQSPSLDEFIASKKLAVRNAIDVFYIVDYFNKQHQVNVGEPSI